MGNRETRFEAHTTKRRQRTVGLVLLVLVIGYFRDAPFPSSTTLGIAAAVFLWFELNAAFRGARSLSISDSGITLERSFGGKMLRFTWQEIARAEVRRSILGLVWVFHTKKRGQIRWAQSDFDGNQRVELERALRSALQEHGLPCE